MAPRIEFVPDERAQHWVLHLSASDRAGLLYRVALVLAKHDISLQLAKITTLGERVEDTFLIQGEQLQNYSIQIDGSKNMRKQFVHRWRQFIFKFCG